MKNLKTEATSSKPRCDVISKNIPTPSKAYCDTRCGAVLLCPRPPQISHTGHVDRILSGAPSPDTLKVATIRSHVDPNVYQLEYKIGAMFLLERKSLQSSQMLKPSCSVGDARALALNTILPPFTVALRLLQQT